MQTIREYREIKNDCYK
ncbi:hypothetical protein P9Z88_08070 [Bacillus cereus]|nr:hypothetical protein [Bacillus thuringiensis]MCR6832028.1 hypothetical protein [Bacillus thuringiensis]MEB8931931.1 hypothetical protein [Bacillus cereus]MEC3210451.1 hypothetical protein [Bacillus cereus]MEC3240092.1 hypothetical protein [Bacillus cereus]